MELNHPEDMDLWREWERSRHRTRRAKHAVTGAFARVARRGRPDPQDDTAPHWTVHSRAAEPGSEHLDRLLIAMDSASPTSRSALLGSLPYLRGGIDVLAPAGLTIPELEDGAWTARPLDPQQDLVGQLAELGPGAAVSIGQHLAAGEAAHRLARRRDIPEHVVQHGVLTPFAPPLPPGATLLAWSDADAQMWRAGRTDISWQTVGSQLLWQAGHERAEVDPDARPVFLGQMHGAELTRRLTAQTAYRFCRTTGAQYRPHPSETDVASRAAHRLFERRGIELADPTIPLAELGAPVVAIFSTGVLEAAARGLPAWVHGPDAPGWVHALWDRYGMRRFGGSEPTPAPPRADHEPAALIARLLEGAA